MNAAFGAAAGLYVVARFVALLANLVLAVGVASTIFDWVPRPGIGIIHGAFGVILAVAILSALVVGVVLLVGFIAEPVLAVLATVLIVVLGVPILYLTYHAAMTVWVALPSTYAAQTCFLFLMGSVISSWFDGDDSDDE